MCSRGTSGGWRRRAGCGPREAVWCPSVMGLRSALTTTYPSGITRVVWGVSVRELWRVVATFLWGPLEDVWRVLVMGFEGRCDVRLRGLAKASHGC